MSVVISVENVSKAYRLGMMGGATLKEDFARWWAKVRGKPDPLFIVGQEHHPGRAGERFWALDNVDFEAKENEVLGIIGRNGAGKSTLLKILSQITAPTSGQVKVKGRIGSLLEVGTGFHPELTGRENIFLNGAILGMTKAEIRSKLDEIIAFSEIEKFIDTPVKRYSSGMYVRLGFAVAAHLEPEILIVDEVLAVGDVAFQKKCLGKLEDVAGKGRTVFFVSHNIQAINTLCDRCILLDQGRVKKIGKTDQVVMDYLQAISLNMSDLMEQTWPDPKTAPGNERILLRRIAIKPERDDGGQLVEMTTPFRVELEYWNLMPSIRLQVNMSLYTLDGAPAFVTPSDKEPNWHGKPFPKGLFRSTCNIPANLMNQGTFRIRFLFLDDSLNPLYDNPEAAILSVHDTAKREDLWYGREPGPVHPKLIWKTECINTDD